MEKFITTHICSICGTEYISNPGYCDESIDCAFDEGASLVTVQFPERIVKTKIESRFIMKITVKVLDRKAPAPSFLRSVEFDSMESAQAYAEQYRNSQFWSVVEVR